MKKMFLVRYVLYALILSAVGIATLWLMLKVVDYGLPEVILAVFLIDALISIVLSIVIGWSDLEIASAAMIFAWMLAWLLGSLQLGPYSYLLSVAVIAVCYPALAFRERMKQMRALKKEAEVRKLDRLPPLV